jgi:ethanolamine utilization protein EutM
VNGERKMQEALGIIETLGFTTAMDAADASVKAANVKFGDWLKVGGGKVSIIFRGEIAAVKAAVEAGVASASQIGEVQGQTIIPRPSSRLTPKFPIEAKEVK